MMVRILAAVAVLAAAFAAWQYVRAERNANAADRLKVREQVQQLRKEARDETDGDLADSISRP